MTETTASWAVGQLKWRSSGRQLPAMHCNGSVDKSGMKAEREIEIERQTWMNGWIVRYTDKQTDGSIAAWMQAQVDGSMGGWMNGLMHG